MQKKHTSLDLSHFKVLDTGFYASCILSPIFIQKDSVINTASHFQNY